MGVLRPGRYRSLTAMGLNDRVSSVRIVNRNARVDENRYSPGPSPVYDNRRRNDERLYLANVTSVRAVVGPPEQRLLGRTRAVPFSGSDQRPQRSRSVIGAVIGGVLGHQVGSGTGNTVATVGGAVAGGAVGPGRSQRRRRAASADPRRPALRNVSEPGRSRPLGCHLRFSRPGASHASDVTPRDLQ